MTFENKITDLIPQRPPIVMVDEFWGIEDSVSRSCLAVSESCIFVNNGRLSECGLIEHVAQSAAARIGYIKKSKNEKVPLGYIGAVNNFKLEKFPKIGDKIITEISVIQEVFSITLIQATCRVGEEIVATCRMKIFLEQ